MANKYLALVVATGAVVSTACSNSSTQGSNSGTKEATKKTEQVRNRPWFDHEMYIDRNQHGQKVYLNCALGVLRFESPASGSISPTAADPADSEAFFDISRSQNTEDYRKLCLDDKRQTWKPDPKPQ
jgi:hypothetical protein